MVTIDMIEIGDTYPVNYDKLKLIGDRSDLYSLNFISLPNPQILNQHDRFDLINNDFDFLIKRQTNADFSIAVVNRPIQGNYFSQRISDRLIVVSTFNIEALNIHEGISLEMYLTRFIYGFVTIYEAYNNNLPTNESVAELFHENATGCLFDFCIYKPQVAKFFRQPKISPEALTILRQKTLPVGFLKTLENNIKKLKIGRYYRLKDWFKENPVTTLAFTFFVGLIFSELLGNYIYDLVHDYLPNIKSAIQTTK